MLLALSFLGCTNPARMGEQLNHKMCRSRSVPNVPLLEAALVNEGTDEYSSRSQLHIVGSEHKLGSNCK